MTRVGPKYLAPLHNSDSKVLLVADAPQAAHVNYQTLVAVGGLREQTDFTLEGARAITDPLNQMGVKASVLLERIALLSPAARAKLTRQAEANLEEQTGKRIKLDDTHPSAPLLIWADRSNYAFTSDGYAIMGLRSNRNHVAVARIVPPGIGWASVKAGKATPPKADAKKEFKEEFGLESDNHRPLGNIFAVNTIEGYTYESADKSKWLPGVIPAFSYAGYTKLDRPLQDIVREARLNNENFGIVAIHHSQFAPLLKGRSINAVYFSSDADASREVQRAALPHWSTERYMDDPTSPPPYHISEIREAALKADAPKIAAKSPEGETAKYASAERGDQLVINLGDFFAVGRNFGPEMVYAASKAGLAVDPQTAKLAKEQAQIVPVGKSKTAKAAFGARRDQVAGSQLTA